MRIRRIAAGEARQIDGIGAEHIRVIPNAVLPASGHAERRASARAGWGFDDSQVVVGCVGNYKPGKGLLSLLTVADQLRQERPELRYVLVGEGPLRSDLEDGIERLALHDIVVLHGRDADARSLYGSFDIYVQASDSEGLPNVILEAAASGLPIVATAVGGTSEILTSNVDGILVAKGDVHGLALGHLGARRGSRPSGPAGPRGPRPGRPTTRRPALPNRPRSSIADWLAGMTCPPRTATTWRRASTRRASSWSRVTTRRS